MPSTNHLSDIRIAVGRDRTDLANLVVRLDLLGALLEIRDDDFHRLLNAALQVHRVHAGRHRLGTFTHDGMGENCRRRGAVAGGVVGLLRHFAYHLRAHVLELVGELDFLGDRYAVLRGARRAVALVEDDITALGTERDPHCIRENVDAAQQFLARVAAEFYVFRCHIRSP